MLLFVYLTSLFIPGITKSSFSSSSKPGIVRSSSSTLLSNSVVPGITKSSLFSAISSFSIFSSTPGITIFSFSSSSSPGITKSSWLSSLENSNWFETSTFFLGLPLFFLGASSVFSGRGFFLGLPLLFGAGFTSSSFSGSTFSTSFTSFSFSSKLFSFCTYALISRSICFIGSSSSFTGFGFVNFLVLCKFTAFGITTGLDKIVSLVFTVFNSISLVPSSASFLGFLILSETFVLNAINCWYLGDFSSNTALTFKGKNLQIIFNCTSLYCEAILLKLSKYLSSFFPKRL